MTDELVTTVDQDSKNLAVLMWVLSIFFGFIPSLIFYLVKKDDSFICDHSKEALNWSITAFIGYILAGILTIIVIGVLLIPVIGICHLVFCIMAAVKASSGEQYRAPICIRLLK